MQLQRLKPAFAGHDVTFVTVNAAYRADVDGFAFATIRDATRWNKLGLLRTAWQLVRLLRRIRPDVVVSTGAAPGYLALRLGRLLGARTVWIDSIANAEELSLAGRRAGRVADLWLTQWPHLARPDGPHYRGAVL
ncbi:MAG: glycosyltransferase [Parvularculaceae bacterium]|nr:glycosyltransferase [Parvularculaceae bacterium]